MSSLTQPRQRAAAGAGEYAAFNGSSDLLALRAVCGSFGAVCLSLLFLTFFVQLGIVLLRVRARKAAAPRAVMAKPDPAQRSVRHLGIIMDGNRRFGRRHSSALHKEPDAAVLQALRAELCDPSPAAAAAAAVIGHGVDVAASSWLTTRYSRFLKLIEHTAFDGHRSGGEKLLEVMTYCIDAGVDMVTAYAFSTDNWERPAAEVDALMALFFFFFDRIRRVALEHHVFVRFIATEPERMPPRVLELMRTVERESRAVQPRRLTLNLCVSYSGQSEVVAACNRILARRLQGGAPPVVTPVTRAEMSGEMLRSITQAEFEEEDRVVFAKGVTAEPELILRTSGELRISNFLLYECAYSEFAFFEKTWPELTREDLLCALDDYAHREKRKGR